jgi:hypothetical protein
LSFDRLKTLSPEVAEALAAHESFLWLDGSLSRSGEGNGK